MATGWKILLAGLLLVSGTLALAQEEPDLSASSEKSGVPADQKRPLPNPRQSQLEALASEVPVSQQLRLTQGEDSFLALYQPANTSEIAGSVLILHDLGQHADWPRVVAPVRKALPDDGWQTLSLSLSDFPEPALPRRVLPDKAELYSPKGREEATGGAEESDGGERESASSGDDGADSAMIQLEEVGETDSPRTPEMIYEERSVQRIAAAVDYLKQQADGPLILIGAGASARLTALYLAANPRSAAEGEVTLIWVNPQLKPEESLDFRRLLGGGPYPRIFDLVDSADRLSRERARERRASAQRLGLEDYEQVLLPVAAPASLQDHALLQRLRTWLNVRIIGN